MKTIWIPLLMVCSLGVAGCAAPVKTAGSKVARLAPSPAMQADVPELAGGERAFAVDLYRQLSSQDGNLFFSPYSLALALAMTYAGAGGATQEQMAQVLYFDLPEDRLHGAWNALDQDLLTTTQEKGSFQLSIANSLWGQEDFPFLAEFLDRLAENYGAGLRLVDFIQEGPREQARQAINNWVSEQTRQKIKDLVPPGALNMYTRLVLANAIYFNGEWEDVFQVDEQPAPFTLRNGQDVDVTFMHRRAVFGYAESDAYQAVEVLYKGSRMSFVVILPAEGQLETFEQQLTPAAMDTLLGKLQPMDTRLEMPKFQYQSEFSLSQALAAMGMADAFDPQKADFSGMDGRRDLFISSVLHKAYVRVNENGTEAAAATGIMMEIVSMPNLVRLDRPFLFLIRDRQSGAILFMGRLQDPR